MYQQDAGGNATWVLMGAKNDLDAECFCCMTVHQVHVSYQRGRILAIMLSQDGFRGPHYQWGGMQRNLGNFKH